MIHQFNSPFAMKQGSEPARSPRREFLRPGTGSENTDDPGSLVDLGPTGGASELMDLMAKIQAVLQVAGTSD